MKLFGALKGNFTFHHTWQNGYMKLVGKNINPLTISVDFVYFSYKNYLLRLMCFLVIILCCLNRGGQPAECFSIIKLLPGWTPELSGAKWICL